ncbi:MAG: amidohydrolase family protein, partial [Halobacteriales archaeon]
AVLETGLRTNAGGDRVQVGGIKTFTDGSFGGRTARVSEPYADAPGGDGDPALGQWVVDPDRFRDLVERVDGAGLQMVTHAIGDEAVDLAVEAYEAADNPSGARHRIEHAELVGDDALARMAETGAVASCQPNFLQWVDEGGLYDQRLGESRRRRSNRFRDLLEAGVPLAFGSDSMPLDPLVGVHHAVNASDPRQRLTVTQALRAYTYGAAYAGFDERRLGTVEAGKRADFVALDGSPWERPGEIREIDVALTVIGGDVVYDGR